MTADDILILNVDDTEAIRYAKTRALMHAGFRVVEAATGQQALDLADQVAPTLVLLDVKLPDINGIEVCRRLKAAHPGMLVLQVSAAFTGRSDRVRGLDSGADSYLTQPTEADELLAAIRALLRLRAAERARHASEARLSALFGQAAVGIARLDLDGRFLDANSQIAAMAGQPVDRLCGTTLPDMLTPEDAASTRRVLAQLLETQQPQMHEAGCGHPDGRNLWVRISLSLVRDEQGRPDSIVAVCIDDTDRREAELRQTQLAREVEHRAKNLLMVIQSIVRLSKGDTIRDYQRMIEGRILALGRAHGLLAASRWKAVELGRLIEEEVAAYHTEDRNRVVLDGPGLPLGPDAAQNIGMLLHELATNSAKHGSLSAPGGRLSVAWDRTGGGGLRLDWREEGGPLVTEPAGAGFGSALMRGLTTQLGGSLRLDWNPAGLRASLEVPAGGLGEMDTPFPA